ncbi:hypothetical protein ACFUIY_13395 [Streptomyces griseorubiginosus]|uniref:hypothetical protein n=1 Tax=Streptomyces griseorubiginosus TaxID=67304 RepID=UPI00363F4B7D
MSTVHVTPRRLDPPAARSPIFRVVAVPSAKEVSRSAPAAVSCRTTYPSPSRASPEGTATFFFAVRSHTPAFAVGPQDQ